MAAASAVHERRERSLPFDPEDPNYIKDLQRPAVIKEDLTEMERRKRVQEILESKDFCSQLEEVIRHEMEGSKHFDDENRAVSLQRLTELALPRSPMRASMHRFAASSLPIADLKGIDRFSRQEKILRNKLASLYRLVDLFQWSQGIYNHITVRHPSTLNEILINPFGLLYHEITASYLIKVDLDGEVLDQGATKLGINEAAFKLHSAIHGARDDVHCVIHMHNAVVSAVSSMKCGLLPICQEAMVIGAVAYHEYQGTLDDEKERQSIIEDLGDKNVMIIRNQGFVACGQSIEEALHLAYNTILACETQIRAARAGIEKLHIPDEMTIQKAYLEARKGRGIFRSPSRNNNSKEEPEWKVGELEWEAWMRVLDNAGFRTGHFYRQPLLRQRSPVTTTSRVNGCNEVACPPASTSFGSIDESDPEALTAHKIALLRKEQEKTRWLNTPNNYQKVEILETGTDRPKVITKWIQDVSATSLNGTPVKITSNHQFSPLSVNPKEFKDKQKAIKENRRSGKTSAGPQSVILDGVTYEDLKDIKPVNSDGDSITGPADRVVLIGTASKGIIDRQHQHNAQVYRQLYAPNPFASETDEDIRKYFQEVESKSPRSQSARGASSRDGGYSTYRSDTTNGTFFEPDRPDTPDSPGAEITIPTTTNTASLMQGAREHRMREESSYAIDELSTSKALDITDCSERSRTNGSDHHSRARSTPRNFGSQATPSTSSNFGRVDSRRHNRHSTARSNVTLSEDEPPQSSEKKKKKRGFFSFIRKSKKDKHKET